MNSTAIDAPHDEIDGPYWSPTRIALGVVVALIIAMWVWIYIWAPRSNPDRLETRAFAEAAQTLCSPIAEDILTLPRTTTETTIAERSDLVAAGTRLTIAMVEGLKSEAQTVTNTDDRRLLEFWFADWDAYILDRESYVERLDNAPADANRSDLAFTLTERSSGGIYTRTIDGFAQVNDMSACSVPQDI